MASGGNDWGEDTGLLQLATLQLIFRQLDLPSIRFLKFRQEDMWGFHQSMRSHWENMTEALQVADYPALEELELELEMDMDAIACDAVLCDVIQDLLCAIHPSRILRRFSVSMTFNVTFYQEEGCPWREDEEDAGLAQPFLRPEVFPDLARLLLLVQTLHEAHPHVNTFHMDLGATFVVNMGEPAPARRKESYAFWAFDYLLNPDPRQTIGDFAPPDRTRGRFTSHVRVDRDEFGRYTVYEDKIRESFHHDFVGGGSSSDEQSGGEQMPSGSEEQLADGSEEHLASSSDSTLTSVGDESEATGNSDRQHAA